MKKILFFSNNKNKINEIKHQFRNWNGDVLSLSDYDFKKEPKENGVNFIENAKIKSDYGFENFKVPCFADDSGICIEALNWGPGVLSKRFMNKFYSKEDCFSYILEKVKKSNKTKAYFNSTISLTIKENQNLVFVGKSHGNISSSIKGNKGFGYDPIFIPLGYNKTFAEMSLFKKNTISHRANSIIKLKNFLFN